MSYKVLLFFCLLIQETNRLVKEVGNAAKETDLTFKYKAKDPKKRITKSSVPFQVYDLITLKGYSFVLRW